MPTCTQVLAKDPSGSPISAQALQLQACPVAAESFYDTHQAKMKLMHALALQLSEKMVDEPVFLRKAGIMVHINQIISPELSRWIGYKNFGSPWTWRTRQQSMGIRSVLSLVKHADLA